MSKKILFVKYINDNIYNQFTIRLDTYMHDYLLNYFDICSLTDLNKINVNNYDLIILNQTSLLPNITKLRRSQIYRCLQYLKKHKNIGLLLHDLHDYSLHGDERLIKYNIFENTEQDKLKQYETLRKFEKFPGPFYDFSKIIKPNLTYNEAKQFYLNFFTEYNIKHLISLYDCPEFDYFYKNFSNTIKNFYIISHGFPEHIFVPKQTDKKYDVFFYGCDISTIYPLRIRLLYLCDKMNLKVKKLERVYEDTKEKKQSEEVLCDYINESYLSIACTSNFSYFVRKYLEISACNCLVVGDTNDQIKLALGDNMVEVNMEMSDDEIINKIKYNLDNIKLINEKIHNNHVNLENYTYKKIAEKLNNISRNILFSDHCEYEYNNYKKICKSR